MFNVLELKNLSPEESRKAILVPIQKENSPVRFDDSSINLIIKESGGYPYFIQFICREAYDSFLNQMGRRTGSPSVPISEIIAKLDVSFFAGRWNTITDRQRDLLGVVANLENCENEFTLQEVSEKSKDILGAQIGNSQINQMFTKLMRTGLIHKTRWGKYSFGIPLLGRYIKRQMIFTNR
jgi:hypothetical protein